MAPIKALREDALNSLKEFLSKNVFESTCTLSEKHEKNQTVENGTDDSIEIVIETISRQPAQVEKFFEIAFPAVPEKISEISQEYRHGLKLVKEKKYLNAYHFFISLDQTKFPDAYYASIFCRAQMDDETILEELGEIVQPGVNSNDLFRYFFLSMIFDKCCKFGGKINESLSLKSYGYVVAFIATFQKLDDQQKIANQTWLDEALSLIQEHSSRFVEKEKVSESGDDDSVVVSNQSFEKNPAKEQLRELIPDWSDIFNLEGQEKVFQTLIEYSNFIRAGLSSLESINILVIGNAGVGKTVLCERIRKIRNYLTEGKKDYNSITTSGPELLNGGVKMLESKMSVPDCILVIDDAHFLNPEKDSRATDILNYLFVKMKEKSKSNWCILSGHPGPMTAVLSSNPGFQDLFHYKFQFDDLSNDALKKTFLRDLQRKLPEDSEFKIENDQDGAYVETAIKRLAKSRDSGSFGNAHAVKRYVHEVISRRIQRLSCQKEEDVSPYDITKSDLLGPDPIVDLESIGAWKKLNSMIGLTAVKQNVLGLVELVKTNIQRELQQLPPLQVSLNRLFIGNPGTAKTTVAKLYGEILKSLGLLSNGEVVYKRSSDFVGPALGQSEARTKALLEAAQGKVLVIDEAYCFYSNINGGNDPNKDAVIDTLVGEIQNVPGEDRCVLMLGYKEEMETMMTNTNPGLSRRFAMKDAFIFEDYTDEELAQILNLKLNERGLRAKFDVRCAILRQLSMEKRRPHFGNGGAVDNILTVAIQNMQLRLKHAPSENLSELLVEDVEKPTTPSDNQDIITRIFGDLVGCDALLSQLSTYHKSIELARKLGREPTEIVPTSFVFSGAAGTAKTTVARRFGQFFHELGILATNEVVEASATDLIGQFVGQTGPKVRSKFQESLGRVLLIDEAHRLDPSQSGGYYATEAVNEMVELLTRPEYNGKLMIILAGYPSDMSSLLSSNAGLASRFSETVAFGNLSPDGCAELLERCLAHHGLATTLTQSEEIVSEMRKLSELSNWANGRDIESLAKTILRKTAMNIPNPNEGFSAGSQIAVSIEEVLISLGEMYQQKQQTLRLAFSSLKSRLKMPLLPVLEQEQSAHVTEIQTHSMIQMDVEEDQCNEEDDDTKEKTDEEEKILERVREIGNCPNGYTWKKQDNGDYVCSGGAHRVTAEQLWQL